MYIIFFIAFFIPTCVVVLYIANGLYERHPQTAAFDIALVVGLLAAVSSLAYRRCAIGTIASFSGTSRDALIHYRGYPFQYFGGGTLDNLIEQLAYLVGNILIWTAAMLVIVQLLNLIQSLAQLQLAWLDKIVAASAIVVLLPLLAAAVGSGSGC